MSFELKKVLASIKLPTCDICSKTFASNGALKRHALLHAGIKEFVCNVCDKQFTAQYGLTSHLRSHFPTRIYRCTEENCDKEYKHLVDYKRHVNSKHNPNQTSLQCPFEKCTKAFLDRRLLTRHIESFHTNVRNFACDVCGRKFNRNSNLVNHKRIHTGEKPYECKTCGTKFREYSTLYKHQAKHSISKQHKCPLCLKAFLQTCSRDRHIRRLHPDFVHEILPVSSESASAAVTKQQRNNGQEETVVCFYASEAS